MKRFKVTVRYSSPLISLLLTLTSLGLLVLLWSTSRITSFEGSEILGLASRLPSYYWVGLTCIVSTLFLTTSTHFENREKTFLLQLFILSIYLYGLPSLIEENPYFYDSWLHTSGSVAITNQGSFHQSINYYAYDYPGFFIMGAIISMITAASPLSLAKFFPFVFIIPFVLISYTFLRNVLGKQHAKIPMIFLISGFLWVAPKHYCPNSIGFVLFLLAFYLLFKKKNLKEAALFLLIVSVITITHPVSMLFLVIIAGSLHLLSTRTKRFNAHEQNLTQWSILYILVVWACWNTFNTKVIFHNVISIVANFFTRVANYLTIERLFERVGSGPAQVLSVNLKIVYSAIYVCVGLIGLLNGLLNHERRNSPYLKSLVVWFICSSLFGFVTGFFQGGQLYERVLLYGFIPLSTFSAFGCKTKHLKVFLILSVLIGTHLSIYATYANEWWEYIPRQDGQGLMFMVKSGLTDLNQIEISPPTRWAYYYYLDLEGPPERTIAGRSLVVSKAILHFNIWKGTDNTYWLEYLEALNRTNCNLIYNNGDFQIFKKE